MVTRATRSAAARRTHPDDVLPLDAGDAGDDTSGDEGHERRPIRGPRSLRQQIRVWWTLLTRSPSKSVSVANGYGRRLGAAVIAIFLFGPELFEFTIVATIFRYGLVAVILYVLYLVLNFRRWKDELALVGTFFTCFGIMLAGLMCENVLVWVVSSTDINKYNYTSLQDNGMIVLDQLIKASPVSAAVIHYQGWNIKYFLGVMLMLPFSVLWDEVPFSGLGMMARATFTICVSRLLRTACFLSTVLPSPKPNCYAERFRPPPADWDGWWAEALRIRGGGGCNDLVFSGHEVIYTTAVLALQTYCPAWSTPVLWAALIHSSIGAVVGRQHYAVDMILAVAVTALVWHANKWIYDQDTRRLPPRAPGAKPDPPQPLLTGLIALILVTVAVIIIGGGA